MYVCVCGRHRATSVRVSVTGPTRLCHTKTQRAPNVATTQASAQRHCRTAAACARIRVPNCSRVCCTIQHIVHTHTPRIPPETNSRPGVARRVHPAKCIYIFLPHTLVWCALCAPIQKSLARAALTKPRRDEILVGRCVFVVRVACWFHRYVFCMLYCAFSVVCSIPCASCIVTDNNQHGVETAVLRGWRRAMNVRGKYIVVYIYIVATMLPDQGVRG